MENQNNEGLKKLAEYLSSALKDKKSSQRIVGEIQMALTMGMFSRADLNNILNTDFDVIIESLCQFDAGLKSPKSRVVLKSVMDALKK